MSRHDLFVSSSFRLKNILNIFLNKHLIKYIKIYEEF